VIAANDSNVARQVMEQHILSFIHSLPDTQ